MSLPSYIHPAGIEGLVDKVRSKIEQEASAKEKEESVGLGKTLSQLKTSNKVGLLKTENENLREDVRF